MTESLEKIVVPACSFYDPIISLKFPFTKSDSQTRFINITDHNGKEIEMWTDEFGFIYEVNVLIYKNITSIDKIIMLDVEIGIPYFDFGQDSINKRTVNFEIEELLIGFSSNDLFISFCTSAIEHTRWIGYDKMYFGVSENNRLISILYKDCGLINLISNG